MNRYEIVKGVFQYSTNFYLISTEPGGTYQYVNPAYQKAFAHIDHQLTGQPFHITMHPDDVINVESAAQKCFAEPHKSFPATIRKHNGTGGYIITQWDFNLIKDDAGGFAGFFCIGYDLTEFENEKVKNKQLDSLLQHTQSTLEYKSELLEQLVFDQSHLLRSPLSNILGLVNLLKKMELDESINTLIEMLGKSSSELDVVVRNIVAKAYR